MTTSDYRLAGTIVAIATPPGMGGIGIVRLSGPESLNILRQLMASGASRLPTFTPRHLTRGRVHVFAEDGSREPVDDVLAVFMPGPASFTGEDVAEIHCHGGRAVPLAVVASACGLGARLAINGEFTYRAFANGKYDLTQAEAVAEIIAAPALQGVRLAKAKLSGLLGERVDALRDKVETLRARTALAIDFPEDEAESLDVEDFLADLETARSGIAALLASYRRARRWREGVPVILAGEVNVGKSSLLNALLGRERALVSATPGTTRDFIEESLDIDGLHVRIADTAGLRVSADPVEMEGVAKAKELAEEARLVLLVVDASQPMTDAASLFMHEYAGRVLLVRNKIDLLDDAARDAALTARTYRGIPAAAVSARSGLGLEALAARLRSEALAGEEWEPEYGDIVPNLRQSELLALALAEADALAGDVRRGIACDVFSVRLDAMAMHLAEITGYATTDAILERVFSSFCIGK